MGAWLLGEPGRLDQLRGQLTRTHMRRGHWRRQRVGPREDWRYEQRWIAPVLVNPGNNGGTVTVYRLPEPPEAVVRYGTWIT